MQGWGNVLPQPLLICFQSATNIWCCLSHSRIHGSKNQVDDIYKELAHVILETGKSQDLEHELSSGNSGELMVSFQSKSEA